MIEPSTLQVLQRLRALLQRLVVIVDHPAEYDLAVGIRLEWSLQLHRRRGRFPYHRPGRG